MLKDHILQRVANNVLCNPDEKTVKNHQNSLEKTKFKAPVPKKVFRHWCLKFSFFKRILMVFHGFLFGIA